MKNQRGFTLIELLIVVAIIGIIAAIAIPNLVAAVNRGRQKRTMSDMRTIGTAIEAYCVDHGHYPIADTMDSVKLFLDGPYVKSAPSTDGWFFPFTLSSTWTSYTLVSHGRDRLAGPVERDRMTKDFDCDIAYSLGSFVQWPDGIQGYK